MKIRELIDYQLFEASATKVPKGTVPFRTSSKADQHIKNFISKMSRDTGVDEALLYAELDKKSEQLEQIGKYSPLLYATLSLNIVEQATFELIETSRELSKDVTKNSNDIRPTSNQPPPAFNEVIFNNLIRRVQEENRAFFPLRAPDDEKRIFGIQPIIVPTKKPHYEKFNNIPTAACTSTGEFIFNRDFMERLLYFGEVIDVRPKGKKYVCNGGTIPDNYCYLEFLIMHEILHYSWGDFVKSSKFKQYSHTTHNWAQDFRSNYILVKAGYTQLPIGLFSDDLNLDRDEYPRYADLVKAVHEELKKLPRQYQAWVEQEFESDVHESDQDEQSEWTPRLGEIVVHKQEGTFGRIVKILPNDQYETEPVSLEEVEKEYPGVKVR
jgi:hypothetical protein